MGCSGISAQLFFSELIVVAKFSAGREVVYVCSLALDVEELIRRIVFLLPVWNSKITSLIIAVVIC